MIFVLLALMIGGCIIFYGLIVSPFSIIVISTTLISFIVAIRYISDKNIVHAYKNLKVSRNILDSNVQVGECAKIEIVIENNKKLPISFLSIYQKLPKEFWLGEKANVKRNVDKIDHIINTYMSGFQRKRRVYDARIEKRGTYLLSDMSITIGDVLGIALNEKETKDKKEICVYPKIKDINEFKFEDINVMGDKIIKRWIYNDPLYIKGIRDYRVDDRMKDIHWKSSMKSNKLMVKEYDFTSDREVIIILNTQCGENIWSEIYEEPIEEGIDICVSIAQQCIKEGIPVGMWTNNEIVSLDIDRGSMVKADCNSLSRILELCARISYSTNVQLNRYLLNNKMKFKSEALYILVSPYMDEGSIATISKLSRNNIKFKIITVGEGCNNLKINGVEVIKLAGKKEERI